MSDAAQIDQLRKQLAAREAALLTIFERTHEGDVPMNVAADIDQITIEIGNYPTPEFSENRTHHD